MKRKFSRLKENLVNIVLAALLSCVVFIFAIAPALNKVWYSRQVTVTVMDKGIKNDGEHGRYLIYCKDETGSTQVYQIVDSILKLRFDSSDMYPNLEIGKTYKLTICGKRVPFLSWYPNIYEYEKISVN